MSEETQTTSTQLYIPIVKANEEEQTVTGVVLRPEITDAQGDIMSVAVIRKAAHEFLAGYNAQTTLGLMHKDFKPQFELYESWLTPVAVQIGTMLVPVGSWILTVHVLDANIWKLVKTGKLGGFSIGGKAKVQKLGPNPNASQG